MTAVDQIPVDALADDTPEWEQMREQVRRTGTIPKGTYEAVLVNVAVIQRRDTGAHVLRMIARTDRLGRYVHAWRGLSENPEDPYDLTDGQVKGLRKFAEQMGVPVPAPAAEIVERVGGMLGEPVVARVSQTPAGQQASFSVPPVEGTVRILPPAAPVSLEGAAAEAYASHAKVLEGLQAAHYGLACAAEGCHGLLAAEGWTALGFESLSEYLASPEVTLSRTEFYRLASIWERYVIDGGLEPAALQGAGPSKLEVPLPALEAGLVDAERAASDASSMTRADLRARYEALQSGGADDDGGSKPRESRRRDDDGSAARIAELEAEVERLKHDYPLPDDQPVTMARSLASTLRRVLNEVGRPEQKRMSKELRAAVEDALALASEHGLEGES